MAPSERGWKMIIIVAVLVGLATIATVLRVVARLKRRVNIEIDDYLCFTALFLLYGMLVQLILCEMRCSIFLSKLSQQC